MKKGCSVVIDNTGKIYHIGDEIKLSESDIILFSSAFFADIERKYLKIKEIWFRLKL